MFEITHALVGALKVFEVCIFKCVLNQFETSVKYAAQVINSVFSFLAAFLPKRVQIGDGLMEPAPPGRTRERERERERKGKSGAKVVAGDRPQRGGDATTEVLGCGLWVLLSCLSNDLRSRLPRALHFQFDGE